MRKRDGECQKWRTVWHAIHKQFIKLKIHTLTDSHTHAHRIGDFILETKKNEYDNKAREINIHIETTMITDYIKNHSHIAQTHTRISFNVRSLLSSIWLEHFCKFCIKCQWVQHLHTSTQPFEICFIVFKVPLILHWLKRDGIGSERVNEWASDTQSEQEKARERERVRGRESDGNEKRWKAKIFHMRYFICLGRIWSAIISKYIFMYGNFVRDERCVLTAWWFTQFGRNLIRTKEKCTPDWNKTQKRNKNSVRATCEIRSNSNRSSN